MLLSSVKMALLFNVMGLKIKCENKGAKPSTTVTAPSETGHHIVLIGVSNGPAWSGL